MASSSRRHKSGSGSSGGGHHRPRVSPGLPPSPRSMLSTAATLQQSLNQYEDENLRNSLRDVTRPNNWLLQQGGARAKNKDPVSQQRKNKNHRVSPRQNPASHHRPDLLSPLSGGQQHSPRTAPRTNQSLLTAEERAVMENLRQSINFSDNDLESVTTDKSDSINSQAKAAAAVPGAANNEIAPTLTRRPVSLSKPQVPPELLDGGGDGQRNRSDTNHILGRLVQIRDYLKQTQTMKSRLESEPTGDNRMTHEQMNKLNTLIEHLMDQENAYLALLHKLTNTVGVVDDNNSVADSESIILEDGQSETSEQTGTEIEVEGGQATSQVAVLDGLRQQRELLSKMIHQQEELKSLKDRHSELLTLQQDAEVQLQRVRHERELIANMEGTDEPPDPPAVIPPSHPLPTDPSNRPHPVSARTMAMMSGTLGLQGQSDRGPAAGLLPSPRTAGLRIQGLPSPRGSATGSQGLPSPRGTAPGLVMPVESATQEITEDMTDLRRRIALLQMLSEEQLRETDETLQAAYHSSSGEAQRDLNLLPPNSHDDLEAQARALVNENMGLRGKLSGLKDKKQRMDELLRILKVLKDEHFENDIESTSVTSSKANEVKEAPREILQQLGSAANRVDSNDPQTLQEKLRQLEEVRERLNQFRDLVEGFQYADMGQGQSGGSDTAATGNVAFPSTSSAVISGPSHIIGDSLIPTGPRDFTDQASTSTLSDNESIDSNTQFDDDAQSSALLRQDAELQEKVRNLREAKDKLRELQQLVTQVQNQSIPVALLEGAVGGLDGSPAPVETAEIDPTETDDNRISVFQSMRHIQDKEISDLLEEHENLKLMKEELIRHSRLPQQAEGESAPNVLPTMTSSMLQTRTVEGSVDTLSPGAKYSRQTWGERSRGVASSDRNRGRHVEGGDGQSDQGTPSGRVNSNGLPSGSSSVWPDPVTIDTHPETTPGYRPASTDDGYPSDGIIQVEEEEEEGESSTDELTNNRLLHHVTRPLSNQRYLSSSGSGGGGSGDRRKQQNYRAAADLMADSEQPGDGVRVGGQIPHGVGAEGVGVGQEHQQALRTQYQLLQQQLNLSKSLLTDQSGNNPQSGNNSSTQLTQNPVPSVSQTTTGMDMALQQQLQFQQQLMFQLTAAYNQLHLQQMEMFRLQQQQYMMSSLPHLLPGANSPAGNHVNGPGVAGSAFRLNQPSSVLNTLNSTQSNITIDSSHCRPAGGHGIPPSAPPPHVPAVSNSTPGFDFSSIFPPASQDIRGVAGTATSTSYQGHRDPPGTETGAGLRPSHLVLDKLPQRSDLYRIPDSESDELTPRNEAPGSVGQGHTGCQTIVSSSTLPLVIRECRQKPPEDDTISISSMPGTMDEGINTINQKRVQGRSAAQLARSAVAINSDIESDEMSDVSLFEALRETIYSEVAALISQNESRPHFLIELFRELQMLKSDYLRQRALFTLRDLVNKFLTEDSIRLQNQIINDRLPTWLIPSNSENTPSERSLTDDENEIKARLYSKRREHCSQNAVAAAAIVDEDDNKLYDYAEPAESASSMSTPSSPFAKDQLGDTVIHLDQAMKIVRDYERLKADAEDMMGGGGGVDPTKQNSTPAVERQESTATTASNSTVGCDLESDSSIPDLPNPTVDTKLLDFKIQAIMTDVIPYMKQHMDDMCSTEFLSSMRRLVIRLACSEETQAQEFTRFFQKQLNSVLKDALLKFNGKKLRDCGEDLLIDTSEVLFNELAFFKLMKDLDAKGVGPTDDQNDTSYQKDGDTLFDIDDRMSQSDSDTTHDVPTINSYMNESDDLSKQRDDLLASAVDISDHEGSENSNHVQMIELSVSESRPLTSTGSGEDDDCEPDEQIESEVDVTPTAVSMPTGSMSPPSNASSQEHISMTTNNEVAMSTTVDAGYFGNNTTVTTSTPMPDSVSGDLAGGDWPDSGGPIPDSSTGVDDVVNSNTDGRRRTPGVGCEGDIGTPDTENGLSLYFNYVNGVADSSDVSPSSSDTNVIATKVDISAQMDAEQQATSSLADELLAVSGGTDVELAGNSFHLDEPGNY